MEGLLQGSQQPGLIFSPSLVCALPPSIRFPFPGLASCSLTQVTQHSCLRGHVKGHHTLPSLQGKLQNLGSAVAAFKPSAPESDSSSAGRKVDVGHYF